MSRGFFSTYNEHHKPIICLLFNVVPSEWEILATVAAEEEAKIFAIALVTDIATVNAFSLISHSSHVSILAGMSVG